MSEAVLAQILATLADLKTNQQTLTDKVCSSACSEQDCFSFSVFKH